MCMTWGSYILDTPHGIYYINIPQENPLKYGFNGIDLAVYSTAFYIEKSQCSIS